MLLQLLLVSLLLLLVLRCQRQQAGVAHRAYACCGSFLFTRYLWLINTRTHFSLSLSLFLPLALLVSMYNKHLGALGWALEIVNNSHVACAARSRLMSIRIGIMLTMKLRIRIIGLVRLHVLSTSLLLVAVTPIVAGVSAT